MLSAAVSQGTTWLRLGALVLFAQVSVPASMSDDVLSGLPASSNWLLRLENTFGLEPHPNSSPDLLGFWNPTLSLECLQAFGELIVEIEGTHLHPPSHGESRLRDYQ